MSELASRPSVSDVARRGAACGLVGAGAWAVVEYLVTVLFAQGSVRVPTYATFLVLDVALAAIVSLALIPLTAGAFVLARALRGAPRPATGTGETPSRVVPWIWALLISVVIYLGSSFALTFFFVKRFKEPQLIALTLAVLQVGLIAVLALIAFGMAAALRRLGVAAAPRLGRANPLARLPAALVVLAVLLVVSGAALVRVLPQLRSVAPWREAFALLVYLGGCAAGARLLARRGRLLPRAPRKRRLALGGVMAVYLLLVPLALWKVGADPETKYLAISGSPPLSRVVDLVRWANDFDGDGYGTLLGENDCGPFDETIHPGARDIPDNGIDENCSGKDFSTAGVASYKQGEKLPVPPEHRRDWNILLITVDALRYDHTGFGGYLQRTNRDTTPRLDELVKKSIHFTFANAPSAGTMASIPAILVSRFFHSGIALGPERRPKPPKILDENFMIAELMKSAGYRTGAILSHEYFNDWGTEQGFDDYDDSLGARPDPFRITSHAVTDKAQAWIARQGARKWFLWLHYIDPHGRYVAHPGERQFGDTEKDLYDGEIAYTDKHLGRLFDFLFRSPAADRTVIILTSDHGDGFGEHGFINHGMALYRELLHVPLIIYIPDAEPHEVDGPVSPLDIYPTVADLVGVDVSHMDLEGQSLVPQIFYGRDARDRVVFAETNWPDPLRAAITHRYKLIYNLKANVYELYDLQNDPWEKKNIWRTNPAAGQKVKDVLDEWLDRVYFSRDAKFNQAEQKRAAVLLETPPRPQNAMDQALGSAMRVLGWDLAGGAAHPGRSANVTVYFEAQGSTDQPYRFELEVMDQGAQQPRSLGRQVRVPAQGLLPTTHWRKGDLLKETFPVRLPPGQPPGEPHMLLRLIGDDRRPAAEVDLGVLPVAP